MGNLSFWELRDAISKSCTCVTNNSDISNRFGFSIDITKLEQIFRDKKSSCYSLAFAKELNSRVPSFKDIQLISEYMRDPEELALTFNGDVQVCELLVFSVETLEGTVELCDQDRNILSNEEIFKVCNDPESLDKVIIDDIIINLPMYKVLVTRIFNFEKDLYDYNIYIRSNYEMVTYYKAIQEKKEKKSNKTTNKNNK